jgi:hypothetical protein
MPAAARPEPGQPNPEQVPDHRRYRTATGLVFTRTISGPPSVFGWHRAHRQPWHASGGLSLHQVLPPHREHITPGAGAWTASCAHAGHSRSPGSASSGPVAREAGDARR